MGQSVYLDNTGSATMTDAPVPQPPAPEPQPHIAHYPSAAFHQAPIAPLFFSHAPQAPAFQVPVFMQMPMAPIPVLDHTGIFLAGFRDCAAEAIKYLTEAEHMTEADPAIQGLRQHLSTRQDTLRTSSAPSSPEKLDFSSSDSSKDTPSTPKKEQNDSLTDEGYSSILHELTKNSTPIHPSSSSLSPSGHFSSSNANLPHSPVFSMTSLPASPIVSNVTPCVTGPLMSSSVIGEGSQLDNSVAAQSSSEDSTKPLPDLAVLAQSNPAIASVAQELMELLEEEFEGFTDCEEEGEEEDEEAMDESEETERSS